MNNGKPKQYLISAVLFYLICIFQILFELRYYERFPNDKLAIVLYSICIALFSAAGTIFAFKWRNIRKADNSQ